jgi:small subunit ribosomal protein S6
MRKYEAMVIVRPEISDTDVQKIADRFKGVIEEQGGTVEKAAKWDKRKLAYEIGGFREGNYVLINFEADAKIPLELNRQMHITEDILRHRIFRLDD